MYTPYQFTKLASMGQIFKREGLKVILRLFFISSISNMPNKGNAVVIWRQGVRSSRRVDSGFHHVIFIFFEHSMRITFVLVSLALTHYLYAYTIQIIHLFFRCCLGLLVYCKKLLESKKEVWCVVILLYLHRMLLCLESVIVKIARQDVIHVGEKLW